MTDLQAKLTFLQWIEKNVYNTNNRIQLGSLVAFPRLFLSINTSKESLGQNTRPESRKRLFGKLHLFSNI